MKPEIAPIDPMIEVYPWPMWAILLVALFVLLLLVALFFALRALWRRGQVRMPETPRAVALRELSEINLEENETYPLSIRVSDILRRYITAEYELPATSQTSPEFLASAAGHPRFSESDRELLKAFLQKVDLIKFAHLQAGPSDRDALLLQARNFLEGKEGGA